MRRLTFRPCSTIALCLPKPAKAPPAGTGWIHEIKHDGFRILARLDDCGIRLFTRNGYNFTTRFPKITAALESLSIRSCVIDGEAIVVDATGLSVFDALRYRVSDHAAVLCAFDLAMPSSVSRRRSGSSSMARTSAGSRSRTVRAAIAGDGKDPS
jgi:ATP-dependent DNA ligase